MFTQYPIDYTSVHGQINYVYEREEAADITINVIDSTNYEVLGVKKFYNTTCAELNIASILRNLVIPTINDQDSESSISSCWRNGAITVHLAAVEDNVYSSLRTFTYAWPERAQELAFSEAVSIVATLPESGRAISLGERERVTILAGSNADVTIYANYYRSGESEPIESQTFTSPVPYDGLVRFDLLFNELDAVDSAEIETIELNIFSSVATGVIHSLLYQVVERPRQGQRLAWVSQCGALEYYTFPNLLAREELIGGGYNLTIASALEPLDVRKALAQIVSSPTLYLVSESGQYLQATLEDKALKVDATKDLERLYLTINLE